MVVQRASVFSHFIHSVVATGAVAGAAADDDASLLELRPARHPPLPPLPVGWPYPQE